MTVSFSNNMIAIILAGGRGKRLKPVTDYVPKSLIPLDNIPIIEWQIRYLKNLELTQLLFVQVITQNKLKIILK